MNTIFISKWELNIHILFGVIGLASAWLIAIMNKRTTIHKILGYAYLMSTFVIMVTSIIRYFLEIYNFSNSQVAYLVLTYYLFFVMISIVVFTSAFVSVWLMAKRKVLEEPTSKVIIQSFKYFIATLLLSALLVGFSGYRNSFLLFSCGVFIAPYILIPIYLFLSKVRKKKLTYREIEEFHVATLVKSVISMHMAFIFGGARIRYLKGRLDVNFMMYTTFLSFFIFSIAHYYWLKKNKPTEPS